jgi:Fibronectin type III domain
MQGFGETATRLQLTTVFVIALVLAGCSITSTGSTSSSGAPGTVTLSWVAPTDNTNGTPLTDLAGYHIHYGTTPDNLTKSIDLTGTGTTEYEVSGLTAGTYYFSISAYTAMGTESAESTVANKTI